MTSPDDPNDEETLALGVAPPGGSPPRIGGYLAATAAFSPGDLLAGRFRIVRFIAQGGMGEVYEAQDLELKDRVALKTIHQPIAGDARTMERFRREVQLSRRVTHPNVCRIFDIFWHRVVPTDPTQPASEAAFLTMELLSGETLAERLHRVSRIPAEQALPIVTQIAAGLGAAHRAGVVHRDFKCGNVLLVPDAAEPSGSRAVVTDFGLAHASTGLEEAPATSLTGSGFVAGTPAYMSPEQVEGGETTAATDIFALGVVMYEMVTGARPFVGRTPLSLVVKRLKQAPPSPITHVPNLDPKWEAAILRCLERDPADRFGSAADVVRALGGEEVAPGKRRIEEKRRRRRTILAVAAAVLVFAAATAYLLRRRPVTPPVESATTAGRFQPRRSVAVFGFKNLSARREAGWLSAALSEMLTTELSAGEKLRAISGENIARARLELSLADAETLARDTLERIRRNLGTDLVVLGSYVSLGHEMGGQIRLDVRVQDTVSGETIVSFADTGTDASFLDMVSRTGARLRDKLGVGEISAADASGARASFPSSPDAARLYAEGLARLRVFDALGARGLLEKAVAADPAYPLAHSALAAAWSALGYDARAREEARRAFDLSSKLSREDRLAVEARYRETTREWDSAVGIYRTLSGFFPDNLEYGLRLAATQLSAGKRRDSLATAESLRKLPAPASGDPRIDLADARAAGSLSDYPREQAAAESAVRKAEASGARLLGAEAKLALADAASSLGDPKKAVAHYQEAGRAFTAAGDSGGAARALHRIGTLAYRQGNLREARALLEQCLETYRESGNEAGVALALNNLANITDEEGNLAEARRTHERVLEINRRLGNTRGVAGSLGNIASLLQYEGDMAGSLQKHRESLAILRELGEKSAVAVELNNTAVVLAAQADLDGAREMFEEALAIKTEIGNRSSMSFTLKDLGELLTARGDLAGARKALDQSVAIREELGQTVRAAETRILLGALANEEGRSADAAQLARHSAEVLEKEGVRDSQANALAVLAEALLAEGRVADARREIDRGSALAAKSQNRQTRFVVALAAGRVRRAEGRPDDAARVFRAALTEARRGGIYGAELEARLALFETDLQLGRGPAARSELAALERDARAKGFLLIARKAAAAKARA